VKKRNETLKYQLYHAQNRYLYCLCNMYVHSWATESMNQEFIIKRLQTIKTLIQWSYKFWIPN